MTMPDSWMDDQIAARRSIAKILGGRLTQLPQRVENLLGWPPSRHGFALRLPEGLVIWYEAWCNFPAVRVAKRAEAQLLAQRGFRSAFLTTDFSTRCVGDRQPLLLAPPESDVDFDDIALRLNAAGFVGVKLPQAN
jgi:hypothetical protein